MYDLDEDATEQSSLRSSSSKSKGYKQEDQGIEDLRKIKPKFIAKLDEQQRKRMKILQKARKKEMQSNQSMKYTRTKYETMSTKSKYKEVYDGEDRIKGIWQNGLLDGDAQILYGNGDTFKGIFEKGCKVEGKMVYECGFIYEGQYLNEQFHGLGTLTMPNILCLSGHWHNGIIEGNARIQYASGIIYYGPIQDFRPNGRGNIFFVDGSKYEGEFTAGMISGYGQFYQDNVLVASGEWKDMKLIKECLEIVHFFTESILHYL